ncbi:hypothetical protein K438DRAFT_1963090 [Mycena galopus ATCC 62051]|nr:hypothetical protein K438DRAFT_1963090 [Mycena galopus ATCC 62051]
MYCSFVAALREKDKSFLRALPQHDYTARREQIGVEYLRFIQKHPVKLPYILLDYTDGSCEINLGPLDELESELDYETARAVAASGRMQLRLMEVEEGGGTRIWPFSLPEDAEFLQGLKVLSDTLPEYTSLEEVEDRVRELINLTEDPPD